jgi:ribosomal protein L37AE/L43A
MPEGPVEGRACEWCGSRPAALVAIEKARHTTAANGLRVLKRKALEVWMCVDCKRRMVDDGA